PILALPTRPVFPKVMVPIELDSPELKRMVKDATKSGNHLLGLVLERESTPQTDGAASVVDGEIYDLGVVAQIVNVSLSEDGQMTAVLSALDRVRIVRVTRHSPYMMAEVEYPKEKGAPS